MIRNVVEEAVLADRLGVDFIGVGEHHRDDFAVSSPETVLAAIAGRTERIRLGSAVTVLSSDDPVRVFQRFATLDAVSNGRAEVILGPRLVHRVVPAVRLPARPVRGAVRGEARPVRRAAHRAAGHLVAATPGRRCTGQQVYPRTERGALTTWVGVGGSPQSVVRAARYGLPLMIAIIGGESARFAPFVDLYHRALDAVRAPAAAGRRALARPRRRHRRAGARGAVAALASDAQPHRRRARLAGPTSRAEFDQAAGPDGALYVGSPETVARKIAATVEHARAVRFDMKYSAGTLPHEPMMRSIELYGTEVIPASGAAGLAVISPVLW